MTPEFIGFPKMPRLSREVILTEKLDGTNAQIFIASSEGRPVPCAIHEWTNEGDEFSTVMLAGSRTRWITPEDDNYGFAAWVRDHREELLTLPPGRHFGEWWGQGIQRKYGLREKRWSLFNVQRFHLHGTPARVEPTEDPRITRSSIELPQCVGLVPVLGRGIFNTTMVDSVLFDLKEHGSVAAPGFMEPEGIIIYHVAGNLGFKKTLSKDEELKGKQP